MCACSCECVVLYPCNWVYSWRDAHERTFFLFKDCRKFLCWAHSLLSSLSHVLVRLRIVFLITPDRFLWFPIVTSFSLFFFCSSLHIWHSLAVDNKLEVLFTGGKTQTSSDGLLFSPCDDTVRVLDILTGKVVQTIAGVSGIEEIRIYTATCIYFYFYFYFSFSLSLFLSFSLPLPFSLPLSLPFSLSLSPSLSPSPSPSLSPIHGHFFSLLYPLSICAYMCVYDILYIISI